MLFFLCNTVAICLSTQQEWGNWSTENISSWKR